MVGLWRRNSLRYQTWHYLTSTRRDYSTLSNFNNLSLFTHFGFAYSSFCSHRYIDIGLIDFTPFLGFPKLKSIYGKILWNKTASMNFKHPSLSVREMSNETRYLIYFPFDKDYMVSFFVSFCFMLLFNAAHCLQHQWKKYSWVSISLALCM